MKKFVKIVIGIFTFFSILIIIDFYIYRGYFYQEFCSSSFVSYEDRKVVDSENLQLNIRKSDSSFHINFKNKSLRPYFVMTYRWDINFPVNDSIFFLHSRSKTYYPMLKTEYDYGMDCGTGVGYFSINPLENFKQEIGYHKLIKEHLVYDHRKTSDNDTINDLFYNKPLIISKDDESPYLIDRDDLTAKDSLSLRLYIPVFSYNYGKLIYVKSNKIKVSFLDIIKNQIEVQQEEFQNF